MIQTDPVSKCDGELPGCRNCAKSKRTCTGYHRKHAFILSKEMAAEKLVLSSDHSSSADGAGSGMVMVSRWRANPSALSTVSLSKDKLPTSEPRARAVVLPRGIPSRNVFREKLFSLFIEYDFPAGDVVRFTFGERNDWMSHVINLPSLTPSLEHALLAVCMARLGRHAALPTLVHESLKLYTKGLLEIRRDISNTSEARGEQSLAACLALLLYEITECPGGTPDGYMAHYRGTMKLLQVRGAGAHTSGLAHSVFQILRMHAVGT